MAVATPFVVATSVTVQGGFGRLSAPLAVETECVKGTHFVTFSFAKNLGLHRALGFTRPIQSDSGKEYESPPVIMYINELRNKAVSALLNAAVRSDDPYADADIDDYSDVDKRAALFLKYDC